MAKRRSWVEQVLYEGTLAEAAQRVLSENANQTRCLHKNRQWMDGSSSAAAVTFFVWGLLSLYLQAPPDHFCGKEPCPVRRTGCGEGWRDFVRWPSRGMLQTLAAPRPTLFNRVPTPLWPPRTPRSSYLRQIYVVAHLSLA